MPALTYDAIVVGGGHNGLVAAAYVARSGARVLVLEAREAVGGAATTEAPWPDAPQLRVTRLSYVMSLMPPTILRDLSLEAHGYRIFPIGPYYQAYPEGGSLTLYEEESRRAYDEIAREGRPAARPFTDGVIPTAFDRALAPEGTHIMSLFTWPSAWARASWCARWRRRGWS